jgi:hypothetical protein
MSDELSFSAEWALENFQHAYLPENLFGKVETICQRFDCIGRLVPAIEAAGQSDISNVCLLYAQIVVHLLEKKISQTNVRLVFVENDEISRCFVTRIEKGNYAIVLTTGAWMAGQTASYWASSLPNARLRLGLPPTKVDECFPDYFEMTGSGTAKITADRRVAFSLFTVGAVFLFFHEIGHIVNGHIDSDVLGVAAIDESQSFATDQSLVANTLEWDADGFATAQTIKWLLETPRQTPDLASLNYASALRFITVGSMCFFVGLAYFNAKDIEKSSKTHPKTAFRMLSIVENTRLGAVQKFGNSAKLDDHFNEIIDLVIDIWDPHIAVLPGRSLREIFSDVELADEDYLAVARLHQCWSELRPKLVPFVHGNFILAS